MAYTSWVAVFLVGLLGSGHCAGMCGGIAGALSLQSQDQGPRWRFVLAYNVGRVGTYALAGAAAGGLGMLLLKMPGMAALQMVLFVLTQFLLLALGFYLLGFNRAILAVESLGGYLWRRIQPLTLPLFPVRSPWRALILGSLWGFIPCGLVYSILFTAAASGDAITGAGILAAFGLGTMPTMLAVSSGFGSLRGWLGFPAIRWASGALVSGFGLWGFFRLFTGHVVMMPGSICIAGL
jgi:sulfite exporter TauE/SafE